MKFKKKNERKNKIKYDNICMECNKNVADRIFEIDLTNKKTLNVRLCNTCILVYIRRYLKQELIKNEIKEVENDKSKTNHNR